MEEGDQQQYFKLVKQNRKRVAQLTMDLSLCLADPSHSETLRDMQRKYKQILSKTTHTVSLNEQLHRNLEARTEELTALQSQEEFLRKQYDTLSKKQGDSKRQGNQKKDGVSWEKALSNAKLKTVEIKTQIQLLQKLLDPSNHDQ